MLIPVIKTFSAFLPLSVWKGFVKYIILLLNEDLLFLICLHALEKAFLL